MAKSELATCPPGGSMLENTNGTPRSKEITEVHKKLPGGETTASP